MEHIAHIMGIKQIHGHIRKLGLICKGQSGAKELKFGPVVRSSKTTRSMAY